MVTHAIEQARCKAKEAHERAFRSTGAARTEWLKVSHLWFDLAEQYERLRKMGEGDSDSP
jgi:hypothetical protein